MDALKLGDRRLLLVLGALAVERAEVGGGSRLLLGRVLPEHGVGLGRVIVHRVAQEEKELSASVWLVSGVACQQSIQQVIYSCVRERGGVRRSGSGGTAVHGRGAWLAHLGELWVSFPMLKVLFPMLNQVVLKPATQMPQRSQSSVGWFVRKWRRRLEGEEYEGRGEVAHFNCQHVHATCTCHVHAHVQFTGVLCLGALNSSIEGVGWEVVEKSVASSCGRGRGNDLLRAV